MSEPPEAPPPAPPQRPFRELGAWTKIGICTGAGAGAAIVITYFVDHSCSGSDAVFTGCTRLNAGPMLLDGILLGAIAGVIAAIVTRKKRRSS